MDVAGALLPFTQVVRPELTIHVQEVLTQADGDKPKIEINEPEEEKSPKGPAWWLFAVLPKKHVHFETSDVIYYF